MPSGVKDIQLLELKDTISQLNKTISTQNELISSLQKMLEERNAKDSEKDLLIANLQSQLAYLKNKVFGSTSEIRHDQLDGQLNLFGTPVGDEKPAEVIEPEVISVKGYTKERKPKATYDDKYNSVRSICKHFFTDIVGLSIKFFCVSLRHMSILSREKAEACYREICPEEFREGLIIAADTIVYKDEILGKPKDEADAFRMLSSYRNTVHQVMTGVTLMDVQSGAVHSFCETTHIRCKDYSDEDIWSYIRECRPFDKAGAYGIQEDFSKYIDRCDGDYENVVGLPFSRLERETDEFTENIR